MQAHIPDFLSYLASEKGLAANTLEAYQRDVLAFSDYLKGHYPLEEVKETHLVAFLGFLQASHYASTSISRTLIALKVFFRFLKREGIISYNPTLYLASPKLWQLIPEVLTQDEVNRLIGNQDGSCDSALIELLYSSGLRVSELVQLKIADVDDECIRVFGKGNKERMVPLGKKALQAIDAYLKKERDCHQTDSNLLFLNSKGKALSRFDIWKMIKKRAKDVGITKNISPHTLRHCFATHLLDHGADLRVIQEMLGHSNISSTDRYTHVSHTKLLTAFNSFHPRP